MKLVNSLRDLLTLMGYTQSIIDEIQHELDILFSEIDFKKIKRSADTARKAKDTQGLITCLKELMVVLENKGYYRPDFPTKLIKLLVNGLNLKNEDIFELLVKANISPEEKSKEQEFLASCAAITQLGYILLHSLVPEVKAASSGPHVFLLVDGFSQGSLVFVDYSIDSIKEIDIKRYDRKDNYFNLKKIDDNKDIFELLIKYYSSFHITSGIGLSHNIHNNLGIAYEVLGIYERSIEELNAALRLDPGYTEVHNNLAVTYDKMEKSEEAINELNKALKLNPDYPEAHGNLGLILAKLGKFEDSFEELKEAIRLKPTAIAHNNLGHVYALQNRNEEALMEFMEALRIDPGYAPSHNNIANIYSESGRNEDAVREFQEALRLSPEFPEAYQGIGSVYYRIGSYDRAAQAWIRAVNLEPQLLECVPEKLMLKVMQGAARSR
jgi:tetratricopeptide (TPR) repeat protein